MVDNSNQEGREYNFADNEDIDNNYWTNRLLTSSCKSTDDRNNIFCTKQYSKGCGNE